MPGNLAAAAPVGVLPPSLYTAFSESRLFPIRAVVYHDGTTERALITDTVNAPASIRTLKLSKRLTPAVLATLRTFWEAHLGGLIPFYFYNPFEPAPGQAIGSNHDPTGASTQGRYIAVFRGDWSEVSNLARSDVSFEIAFIA